MEDSKKPANDAAPLPADDPEILALLAFEPVPVRKRVNGWDAEAQRAFIALLATTGSKLHAAAAIGRNVAGIDRILDRDDADGFRAAFDRAMALFARRSGTFLAEGVAAAAARRRKSHPAEANGPLPGQVMNEHGEWEEEASYQRRAEEARDSISMKLQRARRLFLHDIAGCPAKRAAFEILAELPVDWEKAEQCLPQADEPWRKPSARDPDLLLTAEAGWLGGEFVHGPDRKAELLAEINEWRAERDLPLVCWKGEGGELETDEQPTYPD